jgi:hypothetical protein
MPTTRKLESTATGEVRGAHRRAHTRFRRVKQRESTGGALAGTAKCEEIVGPVIEEYQLEPWKLT